MKRQLTLEYWIDDSWYVGQFKDVPDVFSQGATLNELEENIQDAYSSMADHSRYAGQENRARCCMKRADFVRALVGV